MKNYFCVQMNKKISFKKMNLFGALLVCQFHSESLPSNNQKQILESNGSNQILIYLLSTIIVLTKNAKG